MSSVTREELERRFPPTDDPERLANRWQVIDLLLAITPQVKQELHEGGVKEGVETGELKATRSALRRVLAKWHLTLSPDQDARIETCTDLTVLQRWHDQALSAASTWEALR
ncbi:hypothetical protein [Chondromyces apiculatus]|uniref:Uncharacterized protein n=1 Tax=Chondromyces apiculatus DSM 436 TaxID=1192034 RepID=A0A017SZS6_9BACT|nr:hypothetical protein [Chondromyces apiculatus]EYF02075.1 Hypothetical protein CAP_7554 [Chondromyces apiculatus DSM 436]